jgi:hypothetical protein
MLFYTWTLNHNNFVLVKEKKKGALLRLQKLHSRTFDLLFFSSAGEKTFLNLMKVNEIWNEEIDWNLNLVKSGKMIMKKEKVILHK